MVNSCTSLSRGIKLLLLYATVFRTVLIKKRKIKKKGKKNKYANDKI